MKSLILVSTFVVLACAFVAGCGEKQSNSSAEDPGSQLTASDLAMLMDFHAWNVRIPESQQPFRSIRLVIVKPDGTIVPKFSAANQPGYLSCSSIVLGFRVEQGTFSGHFNIRDTKGGGQGYGLSFTDAFANSDPAWVIASPVWNGNRAQLARATKSGEMKDSILAIELLK
ncbi:MAG: hypothetical protein ABSC18_08705 [Verrucomicrobiota bacterium]|jgi:hypothetical protein